MFHQNWRTCVLSASEAQRTDSYVKIHPYLLLQPAKGKTPFPFRYIKNVLFPDFKFFLRNGSEHFTMILLYTDKILETRQY